MGKERSKFPILLDSALAKRLNRAVEETATNRSFLVLQSIQGLQDSDVARIQKKRYSRVNVWVPNEVRWDLRRLARNNGVSQQAIIRHRLSKYLKNSTRQLKEATPETSANEEVLQ